MKKNTLQNPPQKVVCSICGERDARYDYREKTDNPCYDEYTYSWTCYSCGWHTVVEVIVDDPPQLLGMFYDPPAGDDREDRIWDDVRRNKFAWILNDDGTFPEEAYGRPTLHQLDGAPARCKHGVPKYGCPHCNKPLML